MIDFETEVYKAFEERRAVYAWLYSVSDKFGIPNIDITRYETDFSDNAMSVYQSGICFEINDISNYILYDEKDVYNFVFKDGDAEVQVTVQK